MVHTVEPMPPDRRDCQEQDASNGAYTADIKGINSSGPIVNGSLMNEVNSNVPPPNGCDVKQTPADGSHINGNHVNGAAVNGTSASGAHHNDPAPSNSLSNGIHAETSRPNGSTPQTEPIAVVGMACRLPGDVKTPIQFWEMCARRRHGWSEIPAKRFNAAAFHHPNPGKSGTFNPTGGSFLQDDLALFDAPFFNISAQEAQSLDPQQRILLECAYEALEDGGVAKEAVGGEDVGVFIGSSFSDYELNNLRDVENIPMYQTTGNAPSTLSNRISYFFNLRGPSFSVDTACSSSLVALHIACESLRHGESSQALVGGCHLNLTPEFFISMSMSRLFSDSGRCYAFDEKGQSGFGRGEGAGMIVLKRLSDAVAAGDPIRAVIVGSGVNQDGATQGLSTPSFEAQERLIRSVYKKAGVDPRQTGYVEAHGTGTKVGDPIEATALRAVFAEGRTKREPLYVGSVKSNVGHSEGASGIVSVIKTAMMLERGFILPNCDFTKTKENIPFDAWNFKVPQRQVPWPANKKYASVNNFGYGGTNAHVVLAKAPPTNARISTQPFHLTDGLQYPPSSQMTSPLRKVFVLSANDEQAALAQMKNLGIYCEQNPEVFDLALLDNLAYTLGQRRSRLNWRAAITASAASELVIKLAESGTKPSRAFEAPIIGFVFTGQGAQWNAMGRELMTTYPVFANTMLRADRFIAGLGAPFSIVEELSKDMASSLVSAAYVSQPACTAVQIALVELVRTWGVSPCAVVGHSSGEIAAAYAAGMLSLEDCMSIAYWRGAMSRRLEEATSGPSGAMMAVGASEADMAPYLMSLRQSKAVVACINSDSSVTISGDEEAIKDLQDSLTKDGIFNRRLQIGVAYHSHHMQRIAEEYRECIRHIVPKSSSITFHSSVYGRLAKWSELNAEYWVDNLVSPVQFSNGLRNLLANGRSADGKLVQTLVELGPHPALEGPVMQTVKNDGHHNRVRYVSSLRRKVSAVDAVQQTAATLFTLGLDVNLGAVNFPVAPERQLTVMTNLPRYPWTLKTRYWHESRVAQNFLHRQFARSDLLGSLSTESDDIEPRWRNILRIDDMPWIRDHQVQGNNVYPMSGFIAMALEAATQHTKMRHQVPTSISLREVTVGKALMVQESSEVETMLALRPYAEGTRISSNAWSEFRVFSWVKSRGWDEHCRGLISVHVQSAGKVNPVTDQAGTLAAEVVDLAASTEASCSREVDINSMYEGLEDIGFHYRGLFRGLDSCRVGERKTVLDFKVPTTQTTMPLEHETDYIIHPSTLDICVQTVWPLLGAGADGLKSLYMPTFLKSLTISSSERIAPGTALRIYGKQDEVDSSRAPVKHSFTVVDPANPTSAALRFEDLVMTPISNGSEVSASDLKRNLCYKVEMKPHFDLVDVGQFAELKSSISVSEKVAACLERMICLNPHMSMLEIGGENTVLLPILETLGGGTSGRPTSFKHYTYTRPSSTDDFKTLKETFTAWQGLLEFKTFDPSIDPSEQGFALNTYDVVIVSDAWSQNMLAHVRSMLKSGGKLMIINNASQTIRQMSTHLHDADFSGVDVKLNGGSVVVATAGAPTDHFEDEIVIVRDNGSEQLREDLLSDGIFALSGKRPTFTTLAEVDAKGKLCVVLYELDSPKLSSIAKELFNAMQQMLLSASGVLWVVREASSSSPESNLITGLARSVRSESNLRFATLDLDGRDHVADEQAVDQIVRVFSNVFGSTRSVLDNGEMEFIARGPIISVPRVVEDIATNEMVQHQPTELLLREKKFSQFGRPLKMALEQPGLLDTIYFTDDLAAAKPLPENFIEIKVEYAGLNFKDVMHAMGQLHSDSFGLECSGMVSQVGSQVTDIIVGDRVCAVVDGSLANFSRCQATSAWKVPDNVEMEAACTVPVVFCTAYYSLVDVAQLQAGENVLIHAAAGGVGQAAIMIAQAIGANIFATVGSIAKKEHIMKTYNIPECQIFFSRDLSFVDGVQKATNGVGVDVVLNSLAGEALRSSFECMAPLGRFVEIGKRDIKSNTRLEMSQFDHNIMFASVDLIVILNKRPKLMKRLLKDVFAMFEEGELKAVLPRTCYPVPEVHAALSSLQSGRAMGKVAIKMEDDAMVKVNHRRIAAEMFRSDAAYLIVGGTGGLGRSLAIWMAENGAKHLVLVSRSGGDPETMHKLLTTLEEKGAQTVVVACDMSNKASVEVNLKPALKKLPSVAGAVYGAMVLRDCLFEKMTYEDYDAVIKPKVDGVWNLHNCLLNNSLDFFITISSLAGIVGNRGQAAYAATATFMDAFVQYRKGLGLPCSTIDLAPVIGIGYLAENLDKQKLVTDAFGGAAVDTSEIHGLFAAAVSNEIESSCNGQCITGMNVTPTNSDAFWMCDPRFAVLKQNFEVASAKASEGLAADPATLSVADAIKQQKDLDGIKKVAIEGLIRKVSAILMRPEDDIQATAPLVNYGLDSLVAIEFRNWIARELGAALQILEILAVDSMIALVDIVVERSKLVAPEMRDGVTTNGEVSDEKSAITNHGASS